MKVLFMIGVIIVSFGVILIFDARPITKKMFGFGDQNEAVLGLKLTGGLLSLIGMILMYCNI